MRRFSRPLFQVPAPWRRWTTRVLLAALVAGVLAIGGWWIASRSSADRADALRAQLRGIDDDSRRIAADNARMMRDVEALKNDPAAIEDIARDQLGLVYPDEVVLKLEPAEPAEPVEPVPGAAP